MYKAHLTPPPARGLRLNNLALAVGDLETMIAWYESRLGFVVTERGHFDAVGADYAMIETAGVRIELVSRPGVSPQPVDRTTPPDHLGVLAALAEHGVDMVWADQQLTTERRSTMSRDPEGNLIHIFGPVTRSV